MTTINDLSLSLKCPLLNRDPLVFINNEDLIVSFQGFSKKAQLSHRMLYMSYIYNIFTRYFSGERMNLDEEEEKLILNFIQKNTSSIKSISKFWTSTIKELRIVEKEIKNDFFYGISINNKFFNDNNKSYSYILEGLEVTGDRKVSIYTATPYFTDNIDPILNLKNLLLIDFFEQSTDFELVELVDFGIVHTGTSQFIKKTKINPSSYVKDLIKEYKTKKLENISYSPSRCSGCAMSNICVSSEKILGKKA